VDFDCSWLFFEARDAASFLQRVGRAGRHRSAEVLLFCDRKKAASLMSLPEVISRARLEEWVRASYPAADDMAWFVLSGEGLWSAYALLVSGMQVLEKDWTLDEEMKEVMKGRLEEIWQKYLSVFETAIPRRAKGMLSMNRRAVENGKVTWARVMMDRHSFRAGNYVVDVNSLRERMLGREKEAGYFQADLKRVMEQGREVQFRPATEKGHVHATVRAFGKRQRVRVTFSRVVEKELALVEYEGISFEGENGSGLSEYVLEKVPMVYVVVPRAEIPLDELDWRIETWLWGRDPEWLVSFGGHALLLKALYERVRAR
jgi:hypothetical protein